jgi:hypothetical protein
MLGPAGRPRITVFEFISDPVTVMLFPLIEVLKVFPAPIGRAELHEPPPEAHDGLIWKEPAPDSKSSVKNARESDGLGAASNPRPSPARPKALSAAMKSSVRYEPPPGTTGTPKAPVTLWDTLADPM